jgi:hypothetical protein
MNFDRFDICAAYNVYSVLWGGDGCTYENTIQVRLSRLDYKPASSEQTLAGLSDNAREIYQELVKRHQQTTSGYVECGCCGDPCVGTLCIGKHGQFPIGGDLCLSCEEHECEIGADDCQVACDECGMPGCKGDDCASEES